MKNFTLEILADLCMMAGIGWAFYHLAAMALTGRSFIIVEPNSWVRASELIVTGLMLLLGLERFIHDWRNRP